MTDQRIREIAEAIKLLLQDIDFDYQDRIMHELFTYVKCHRQELYQKNHKEALVIEDALKMDYLEKDLNETIS